jgi:hypothetical protein
MKLFEKYEPEQGVIWYRLLFEKDEFLVVFHRAFGKADGEPLYQCTGYRKIDEEKFLPLDERVWSLEISRAIEICKTVEVLEIDPITEFLGPAPSIL